MELKLLTQTIVSAAQTLGYKAVVGNSPVSMPPADYPAIVVTPPLLRDRTGRECGILTLRTTITLVRLAEQVTPPADDTTAESEIALRQTLYNDALAIIDAVEALTAVCEVRCLSSEASRGRLTPYGDTSLAITMDVKLKFSL